MNVLGLNPPSKYSKNVARDLLWGCWCKGRRIAGVQFPPLPLIYVATVLEQGGHQVDVVDAQAQGIPLGEIERKISNYDIVFLISATMSYQEDVSILQTLKKKNPHLITIMFGAHPTFLPKDALSDHSVDIIVRKEAEFIIRDLVNALSLGGDQWKQIKGIGYREADEVIINSDYSYIDDLDDLPIPNRKFLAKNTDYYNPIVKYIPWTTALSSRGCPGRCTFCTSSSYYGPKYRTRTAENVVREIVDLTEQGFNEIFYRDELFTLDRKRVFDICQIIIAQKIKFPGFAVSKPVLLPMSC
ncbi:MAG: radical SAM protein [Candidatus Omnitrophica bacterium]|nr:radical SAM protein [Candidatus Omnitrophota bacterium]